MRAAALLRVGLILWWLGSVPSRITALGTRCYYAAERMRKPRKV
jgi:hypothetical protein